MKSADKNKYRPLLVNAGLGSILGSGVIIGLSYTITVWQNGLGLSDGQVGQISGTLTFAIAAGSLLAGFLAKKFGLKNCFNYLNLLLAAGCLIMAGATGYGMLMAGAVLCGFASGADLPISLTMISHDAPDEKTSAEIVAGTQVYWTIGIIGAILVAFATSTLPGDWSGRIMFTVLAAVALITFASRTFSPKMKQIHEWAQERRNAAPQEESVSIFRLFASHKQYLYFFICILVFYCGWNLLANTFGQFQTFMLVKANASQSFATGAGFILNLVCLVVASIFLKIVSGKNRNVAFAAGIVIMVVALVGLAMTGRSLYLIVMWIALQNVGSTFAGEAMYKVWTQESFPASARAGIQGFINGFSRLLCALFAFVTPVLVLPENIRSTMIGFAVMIAVAGLFGFMQIRLQKKYLKDTSA